jgi:hypothetical protein
VVEQLPSEVDATRVWAQLGPADAVPELPGHLVVELPSAATVCDEGFVAVWAFVVATARRRYRRQQAEGRGPHVAVTLRLPDGIDVVASAGSEPDPGRLLAVVAERLRAGTLTAGRWGWDPGVADLARHVR